MRNVLFLRWFDINLGHGVFFYYLNEKLRCFFVCGDLIGLLFSVDVRNNNLACTNNDAFVFVVFSCISDEALFL